MKTLTETMDSIAKAMGSANMGIPEELLEEYENTTDTVPKQYYLDGLDRAYEIGYQNAIDDFNKHKSKSELFTGHRKQFEDAVKKVFGRASDFFDFIENDEYSDLYDVFYPGNDECYIINRVTGEYINWYKFTHIGRDIHSTVNPNDFVTFLEKFKGEK